MMRSSAYGRVGVRRYFQGAGRRCYCERAAFLNPKRTGCFFSVRGLDDMCGWTPIHVIPAFPTVSKNSKSAWFRADGGAPFPLRLLSYSTPSRRSPHSGLSQPHYELHKHSKLGFGYALMTYTPGFCFSCARSSCVRSTVSPSSPFIPAVFRVLPSSDSIVSNASVPSAVVC
jgi:hypothetical protein